MWQEGTCDNANFNLSPCHDKEETLEMSLKDVARLVKHTSPPKPMPQADCGNRRDLLFVGLLQNALNQGNHESNCQCKFLHKCVC